jgi:FKBP-type peptidyl-prolyl cis-trans isomerase
MIPSLRFAAVYLFGLALTGCAAAAPTAGQKTATEQNEVLYQLGVQMSGVLQTLDLSKAEFAVVNKGLADGYDHRADLGKAATYDPQVQTLRRARIAVITEREMRAGKAYLERAALTAGARKTASGMVYIPMSAGSGPTPTAKDRVEINYVGRLIDGRVFDSSSARGEPATFALNQVMPCFSEALQLMQAGGKSRIVCAADLTYGDRGSLPDVLPGATLDFEIELLEVKPAGVSLESPPSTRNREHD